MTTSDRVLTVLATWLELNESLPVGVTPRIRTWDGPKNPLEVFLDADPPEEHPVLRGVDTIKGEIVLDVNVDDVALDNRHDMLHDIADAYSVGDFMIWANDIEEDRGLDYGDELTIYDFRITIGGNWEPEGRRQRGSLDWEVVAAPVHLT